MAMAGPIWLMVVEQTCVGRTLLSARTFLKRLAGKSARATRLDLLQTAQKADHVSMIGL
jgi:hypothetical protein